MRRRKNGDIVLFCFFKKNRPDADAMIQHMPSPMKDARRPKLLSAATDRPANSLFSLLLTS